MPYTIHEEKVFQNTRDRVRDAVLAATSGLEGKVHKRNEEQNTLTLRFHKTIHGQVLGDRTVFEIQLKDENSGTLLAVDAYPVDAVYRKLMFGARKGVTKKVLSWFWAHVDHNLT